MLHLHVPYTLAVLAWMLLCPASLNLKCNQDGQQGEPGMNRCVELDR